jgi:hypothetical protein
MIRVVLGDDRHVGAAATQMNQAVVAASNSRSRAERSEPGADGHSGRDGRHEARSLARASSRAGAALLEKARRAGRFAAGGGPPRTSA